MFQALKIAFLYIGTSIGAGFSSGKEIALYFGNLSPANVAVSAIFMAILAALFMIAGKTNAVPNSPIVKAAVFMSASISLVAMISGGEFVLFNLTGIPMLGLVMAIVGGVIVVLGIEKIKILNTVLVPLLVLTIIIIFSRLTPQAHADGFSIAKPILYSGLDVLLGGIIISQEGKKLSYKQIAVTSLAIGAFICAMLFMLQNIVLADGGHTSMPVLTVAEHLGLKWACGILIAVAIFTTLVSALHVVACNIQSGFTLLCERRNGGQKTVERRLVFSAENIVKRKKTVIVDDNGKEIPSSDFRRKTEKKPKHIKVGKKNSIIGMRLSEKLGNPKNKDLVVFLCLLAAFPFSYIGFDNIVNYGYPFISYCGILFFAFTLIKILKNVLYGKLSKRQRLILSI